MRTPAKLNLGLEVIRRRPDGYHDLATIFQAIDLFDELHLSKSESFTYIGDPRIPPESDLVRPILEEAAAAQNWSSTLTLKKHIPIAAGLGGGSSDAALALKLATISSNFTGILPAARSIGADVPFFIEGGAAFATGIGDELKPLPSVPLTFVIVTPKLELPSKTATLFTGLLPQDFTTGEAVRTFAHELRDRQSSGSDWTDGSWVVDKLGEIPNAFQRQMLGFAPVRSAWEEIHALAGRVALSGAGPSVYSWHASYEEARAVQAKLNTDDRIIHIARGILPNRYYGQDDDIRELLRHLRARD